jgi:hypothetical protein
VALTTTENAVQLANQIEVNPNLVFKLKKYNKLFGAAEISEYIRIGDPDLYIGDDWVIGGVRAIQDSSGYIQFNTGTSSKLTQKLDPSRAQGSTVTQMVVSLQDANEEISRLVSPGFELEEVLLTDAEIYIGPSKGAFPEDYVIVFRGVVQQYECGPGYINFILSSAEGKKSIPLFPKITANLETAVDYRSATIQDLFYENRDDVTNTVTVAYTDTGTAGSEFVSVVGTNISVAIDSGVSVAKDIRKAIENSPLSNQLVNVKITGDGDAVQFTQAPITLGSSSIIQLDDASMFVEPADALETFVRIDDEILGYTGIDYGLNQLTGVTRGAMGSIPALHNANQDVESVYQLVGNPLDIAVKLMLSGHGDFFAEDVPIKSFKLLPDGSSIDDAIIFDQIDIENVYGIAVGDLVTITGATNPSNNVVDAIVNEIGLVNDGSYMILSTPFIDENFTSAVAAFKSQFNTLPVGMSMLPAEVDVKQHLYIRDTYLSGLERELPISEENDGKDFIETQLYLPNACFSVPRKARSSVAYHVGPVAREKVQLIDASNVLNANQLKVTRSGVQNFANTIRYNYDYDIIKDDFKKRVPYDSPKSKARITKQEKNITINAKGVRSDLSGATESRQSSNRLLNRYALGAEYINGIKVHFGVGYTIEIGDIVAVDYASLKLTDFKTGTRNGEIRLMECINRSFDSKGGDSPVTLDLVNTVYSNNDRYGTISPSTRIGDGSTTTKLIMKKTFSTRPWQRESLKWNNYIGQDVIVRNEDWSIIYDTTISGFDTNDPQGMLVSPALPTAPTNDWVIQCPNYPDDIDPRVLEFWKNRHAFVGHVFPIASGASQTVFTLASAYPGLPFVGSVVRIRNEDFSDDSFNAGEITVTDVSGLVITVDTPIGFIPNSSHVLELIGFPDLQQCYRVT